MTYDQDLHDAKIMAAFREDKEDRTEGKLRPAEFQEEHPDLCGRSTAGEHKGTKVSRVSLRTVQCDQKVLMNFKIPVASLWVLDWQVLELFWLQVMVTWTTWCQ